MAAPATLRVTADGTLTWDSHQVRCALGRGGIVPDKREGDGGTPVGRFPLRRVFYRPDRIDTPVTELPVQALSEQDGWCDDPANPMYNQLISKPFDASYEDMWRADHLYDMVVELGYNDDPVVPGRGSAIFLHVAQPDYAPTEGCVALRRDDLRDLLRVCASGAVLEVMPPA